MPIIKAVIMLTPAHHNLYRNEYAFTLYTYVHCVITTCSPLHAAIHRGPLDSPRALARVHF